MSLGLKGLQKFYENCLINCSITTYTPTTPPIMPNKMTNMSLTTTSGWFDCLKRTKWKTLGRMKANVELPSAPIIAVR